jgi:hypothetical protein
VKTKHGVTLLDVLFATAAIGIIAAAGIFAIAGNGKRSPQSTPAQPAAQPAAGPSSMFPGYYPPNWIWPAPGQADPVTGGYPWAEINLEGFGGNAIGDGMYSSCLGPNYHHHRARYVSMYGPPPY